MNRQLFLSSKKQKRAMVSGEDSDDIAFQLRKSQYAEVSREALEGLLESGRFSKELCRCWRLAIGGCASDAANQQARHLLLQQLTIISKELWEYYWNRHQVDLSDLYEKNPGKLVDLVLGDGMSMPAPLSAQAETVKELVWAQVRDQFNNMIDEYCNYAQSYVLLYLLTHRPEWREEADINRVLVGMLLNIRCR